MAKSILLPIVSSFASKGIKDAQSSLAGLGRTVAAAATSFLAYQSIVGTIDFVGSTITQARDLERNLAGLKTVFGGAAGEMEKFARTSNVMGMSTSEAAKASTFLGTVLKSAGFDMQTTQTETQKLTALAADLAATYGYDVQEALTGMTALFRGEYDPIEKFGVAMKQSEINAELAARGQNNLTGAARRNAEQQIRLELLYQRTMDAQGAFERQSGSLYVEQTKLTAAFKDLEAKVGSTLTPILAELMMSLQPILQDLSGPLLQFFSELGKTIEESLPFIKALIGFMIDAFEVFNNLYASLKPVIPMYVSLVTVVKAAQIAFGLYATSALAAEGATVGLSAAIASNPIGLLVVALGLAVGGMILLNDQLKGTSSYMDEINQKRQGFSRTGQYFDKPTYKSSGINTTNLSSIMSLSGPGWTNKQTTAGDGGTGVKSVKTKVASLFDTLNGEVKKQQAYMKLKGLGASEGLISAILGSSNWQKALKDTLKKGVGATQALFNQTAAGVKEIEDQRKEAAEAAAEAARALAEAQAEEARKIAEAQAEAARQQQEALDRQQAIYESFADSVKNTFAGIRDSIMGAFNITEMGGRASSVIKNVKKLIEQTRKFSDSIRSLAGQGLAPELLQQLIQAGPMAGGKLAASLVQSGVGDLNAAFNEYGALASGIAYTGTQSMFGTQAQQSIYNITVNGGVGSGPTIGKAIVDAIKSYERTSGAVWQGA